MKIACLVADCSKESDSKGLCKSHYDKQNYIIKRDKILAQTKAYAAANKDSIRAYQKEWRSNNKKKISSKNKRNYLARKDHYDNYRAEWRIKNRLKWNGYRSTRRMREKENGIFFITAKEYRKLERDSCFYCGSYENPTIDHVVPIVRGGKHSIGNIVVACKSCNSQKNAKTITEWRKLRCA